MSTVQHDGTLNAAGTVHVHFDSDIPFEDGCVHLANSWDDEISLMAGEALSLLDWLKQEEVRLRAKMKEQER